MRGSETENCVAQELQALVMAELRIIGVIESTGTMREGRVEQIDIAKA